MTDLDHIDAMAELKYGAYIMAAEPAEVGDSARGGTLKIQVGDRIRVHNANAISGITGLTEVGAKSVWIDVESLLKFVICKAKTPIRS